MIHREAPRIVEWLQVVCPFLSPFLRWICDEIGERRMEIAETAEIAEHLMETDASL